MRRPAKLIWPPFSPHERDDLPNMAMGPDIVRATLAPRTTQVIANPLGTSVEHGHTNRR